MKLLSKKKKKRFALEGASVRVAPSMNAQEVANTVWALATLGWQAGEGAMRCALEGAAFFHEEVDLTGGHGRTAAGGRRKC